MTTALLQVPVTAYNVGHLTLHQAVESLHKFQCNDEGWECYPLKPGSWSYDNLAHLIYVLNEWCLQEWSKKPHKNFTSEMLQKMVFIAWKDNYIYWRDDKPYEKDKQYSMPKKVPFNPERDARALMKYEDLPEKYKDKNIVYVNWYIKHLSEH